MQNLLIRAKAAHQAQQDATAQQREKDRSEFAQNRAKRRFDAQHMAAHYAANILGVGPVADTIEVNFPSLDSLVLTHAQFEMEGLSWSVKFGPDAFELDDFNRDEVLAGRRAGLELWFETPGGWFHVRTLEGLGARLSHPDFVAIARDAAHE